ncbi:hypothetical protein [Anaerosporobacter sp.]|uniref:hypothetical protein n=1 Tax=Anaerosporobacter sp. TaxID=1872529 RepID=UPI00286EE001|nr:hypothetical protein [Anaerosporobacter sp.]
MKNSILVKELLKLDIYQISYDNNEQIYENDIVIRDQNNVIRKVITNNIEDDEIRLILQAKQTSFLKSIKSMLSFFTVLTAIGITIYVFYLLLLLSK